MDVTVVPPRRLAARTPARRGGGQDAAEVARRPASPSCSKADRGTDRRRIRTCRRDPLQDGMQIPAELVVMAAGIRPNTALAEASGIYCNRGIVVNDTLQTYDPKIYAVGECVAHRGIATASSRRSSAGQGCRQPSRQLRHRTLHRLGHFDQTEGHRHRPVLGRRLHGRQRAPKSSSTMRLVV